MSDLDVIMTHTAKAKSYRYFSGYQIRQRLASANHAWYDTQQDNYIVPAKKLVNQLGSAPSYEKQLLIVVDYTPSEHKAVVVTQMSKHFNPNEKEHFERVRGDDIPWRGETDE